MNIRAIYVEGFGVWRQLQVEGFRDGLNVIYGPNEAGKTTLLEFIRSVLYGFTSAWDGYVTSLPSGRAGGWLEAATPEGVFRIQRILDEEELQAEAARRPLDPADGRTSLAEPSPDGGRLGRLRILGPHGVVEEGSLLASWLGGVDETTYQNIFALGLREIQQFALLSQTEAAGLLYALSAGVDRVSLVQVMKELRSARDRLLAPGDQPCVLGDLLARQEKLRRQMHAARQAAAQYPHLLAQRDQADQQAQQLQTQLAELQAQGRLIETAIGLRDRLHRRGQLDAQLAALPAGKPVSDEMLRRWEDLAQAIHQHQAHLAELRDQDAQLRRELASLGTPGLLMAHTVRIRSFVEQLPWLSSLEQRMNALQEEIASLEAKLAEQSQQVGLEDTDWLGEVSSGWAAGSEMRGWDRLREPAVKIRRFRRQIQKARQQAAAARQTAEALQDQLQQALADRGCADLNAALQEKSELLAHLRRREQIDKQLAQLQRRQVEIGRQAQWLAARQAQPAAELVGWGAMFLLGAGLVLLGGILPGVGIGAWNLLLASLGVVFLVGAVLGNILLHQHRRRQMHTYSQQRKMLQSQTRQLQQERQTLDAAIPPSPGTLAERIENVQQELALLEQLTPLDNRRESAWREVQAAEERLQEHRQQLDAARRRWRETLEVLGLPTTLSPAQVRKLQEQADRLADAQQRLQRCREEYAQHQQQWEGLRNRIRELAEQLGLQPAHLNPMELVRLMEENVKAEELRHGRRREIRRQLRAVRRQKEQVQRRLARWQIQRRRLLRQARATDDETFRRRAEETQRAQQLAAERETLQREIEAALAGGVREEDLLPYLEADPDLPTQRQQLADRIDQLSQELQACYERRGQLNEQLRRLADDQTLAQLRLQWNQLKQEIAEASRRWQTLALTSRLLDELRRQYEQRYQPETLQEASEYFRRMSEGRYARVWRPLDQEELWVDLAEGGRLPVERLSQGTRELLFLSLRLALAAAYARRGVRLPMILDDVMVNFDMSRARATAALLRDFAQQGNQILLFTCHEHLLKLFQELRVPQAALPDWSQSPPPRTRLEIPSTANRPRRKPVPSPPPEPEPPEAPPVPEKPDRAEAIPQTASTSLDPTLGEAETPLENSEPETDAAPKDLDADSLDAPSSMAPTGSLEDASSALEEDFQWYEALPEEETDPQDMGPVPPGPKSLNKYISMFTQEDGSSPRSALAAKHARAGAQAQNSALSQEPPLSDQQQPLAPSEEPQAPEAPRSPSPSDSLRAPNAEAA